MRRYRTPLKVRNYMNTRYAIDPVYKSKRLANEAKRRRKKELFLKEIRLLICIFRPH